MKKFIIQIALFIPFALIFYIVSVALSGRYASEIYKPNIHYIRGSAGHLYSRLKEVKNIEHDVDILFLGSSHTYRGFDPRNFKNFSCFNLGSSSQTPIQTKVLIDRYLDEINPKLIIYEVFPETFSMDGIESSLDIIANDKNDIYSLEMALKTNHAKVYNSLIFGYYSDLFKLNTSFSEPKKKENDLYIPGGFVEKEMLYFKSDESVDKKEWKFNNQQLRNFERILSIIKDKNIPFILVYAPITKSLNKSYTNNSYFDSLMKTYTSEYYNFNHLLTLDDSLHFYDAHHLNQDGVNIFNKKLLEVIEK